MKGQLAFDQLKLKWCGSRSKFAQHTSELLTSKLQEKRIRV